MVYIAVSIVWGLFEVGVFAIRALQSGVYIRAPGSQSRSYLESQCSGQLSMNYGLQQGIFFLGGGFGLTS